LGFLGCIFPRSLLVQSTAVIGANFISCNSIIIAGHYEVLYAVNLWYGLMVGLTVILSALGIFFQRYMGYHLSSTERMFDGMKNH